MSNPDVRVTVVSDYICPWCYVGMARIERLQREFDIEVVWQPFELHPEIPPEGRELSGQRLAYYQRFEPLARDAGLAFRTPRRVSNSHVALEAAEFAREHGVFENYHRALFEAYFAHGENISDHDVLARLAGPNGLDGGELLASLESKRYASAVDHYTEEARRAGINGAPTFIFEQGERRLEVVGAQDYAVFEDLTARMRATRKPVFAGATR